MRACFLRRRVGPAAVALFVAASPGVRAQSHARPGGGQESPECRTALSADDLRGIRAVIEAYRSSWLEGDAKGVLATFAADAVLLPAHGASPVVGTAAITQYWWPPDAPATKITKLEITIEGVQGGCGFASVYGRDDVGWTAVEGGVTKTYGHPGAYLNVLNKLPDGSWRITRHMWDDGPSQ